jgi:signal transduction histidine kinase
MIQQGKSFGLIAMRERASLIGGSIEIDARKGRGTVVRLRLPLPATAKPRVAAKASPGQDADADQTRLIAR